MNPKQTGWQTTEFWLSLLPWAVLIAFGAGWLPNLPGEYVTSLLTGAGGLATAGYAISRGMVKSSATKE